MVIENPTHQLAKWAQKNAYRQARARGLSTFEAALEGDKAYNAIMDEDESAKGIRDTNSFSVWSSRHPDL